MMVGSGPPCPVVDVHAHLLESYALEVAGPHGAASGFGARPSVPPPGTRFAHINDLMLDPARQIADMDERGVDVHLVSAILAVTPTGWAPPDVALELNRRYNDRIAEAARAHPSRLVGSCTLPLQDLDLALAELTRAHEELGLRVIQLPANVGGVYLGEPPFRPLWEEIVRSGCRSHERGDVPSAGFGVLLLRAVPGFRVGEDLEGR